MKRTLLAGLLLTLLPWLAQAADVGLWIVEPAPSGNLAACSGLAARAVSSPSRFAHRLQAEATIRWAGGQFHLTGATVGDVADDALTDRCFALTIDDRVVASGAVLVPYSARLLRIPVIQVTRRRPLDLVLTSHFPASLAEPVPADWREMLSSLR